MFDRRYNNRMFDGNLGLYSPDDEYIHDGGHLATVTVKIPPDPNAATTFQKPPEKTWEQSLNETIAQLKAKPEYALIGVAVLILLLKRK